MSYPVGHPDEIAATSQNRDWNVPTPESVLPDIPESPLLTCGMIKLH